MRLNNRIRLILVIHLIFYISNATQAAILRGTITDTITSSPISGATVWLEGSSFHATTNSAGEYLFDNVPAGTYTVVVQASNYQQYVCTVSMTEPENPALSIEKSTNGEDADAAPGPIVTVGESVSWTYEVTNTGNVALTNILVTDDQEGTIGTVASLGVGASETLSKTGMVQLGGYTNLTTASTTYNSTQVSNTDYSHYTGEEYQTGIHNESEGFPKAYYLEQNYPNPFNPNTHIRYHLPERERVIIGIMNVKGEEIIRLIDAIQEPGTYTLFWNGRDTSGSCMPSGLYFCYLKVGNLKQVRRLIFMK